MSFKIQAIYQADYLNVLSALMKQLNIADKINQLVSFDPQCQTTPGETVHLLLLDILSERQALVYIEKWAQHIDLEKLLSSDTPAHFFNDDAIGHQLDRLADANIHRVFSELTLHIWKTEQIPSTVFHADTTSKSVYGAYIDEDNRFRITEGYSRDRIGDKQFQYGLIVNADGIPIYGDAHDGNLSDKTWNPDVLEKMAEQAKKLDLSSFIYVADSAAMNKKTLHQAKRFGAYLITRGPNQLKIVKKALEDADRQDDQWFESFTTASTKNGATYRIQEFSSTYENVPVRLIVVESSALDKKKEKTLQKQRQEEYAFLVESQKAFEKRSFHCEADAVKELETWKQKYSLTFHRVHATIESQETIKRKPGRPKKEEEPQRITTYRIVFTHIESDEEAFQKVKRKASRFVLITTVPTEYEGQAMTAQEILALYKGQSSVEMNFSFLKDPFFVDEIYLKKPHRVQVLDYLFLLSLLVYRVF